MTNFYFDIESIPTQNHEFIDEIASNITAPGNYKKQESIEKWEKENKSALVEEATKQTVFDGGMGEIIAFSCAVDNFEIINNYRESGDTEADLLNGINAAFESLLFDGRGNYINPVWVGHYITGYDLRFLWKRFVVNGIRPAVKIPYDAKPWDKNVFDTCIEWKGASKDKGSMDFICKVLAIEGKGDFDGSQVYEAWRNGKYKKISDYCADDVRRTREIYKRITFSS